MNVLNRFEAHEDRLAERVYAKLMQVNCDQIRYSYLLFCNNNKHHLKNKHPCQKHLVS